MRDLDDVEHQAPSMAPPEKGTSRAFIMAAAMHVALILALVIGLHWNTERPAAAQAELWSTLPPPAASVKPTPAPAPPVHTPKSQPAPAVEPGPTDAEIAIAKARQQALERQRAERQAQRQAERKRQADTQRRLEQQAKALARQAEQLAQREAAQQRAADAAKQSQAKQQALAKAKAEAAAKQEQLNALKTRLRQDALKSAGVGAGAKAASVNGAAARPIGNPNGQANATGTGRGDSGYGDQIRACVRPGVVYSPPIDIEGNPTAEFMVQLLPNGEQVGAPRLVKSSGLSNFDSAVEKGIRRCNPFPRPPNGNAEDGIIIGYRMFD